MSRTKEFFKSAVIGGLLVVLPLAIFLFVLTWIFGLVRAGIAPITLLIMNNFPLRGVVVDALAIALLILVCFVVGVMVRTRLGKWAYAALEAKLLMKAPGYSLIKETVGQFLGNKKSPFSSVALAQIFGNDTLVSSFITDEHEDGSYTVFVPTGPNPTSGNIFHLPAHHVHPVDVPIEETMRSIISCGAGSSALVSRHRADGPAVSAAAIG
ncbi:MAG: DUF502 domain-containing protein [Lentisphaerae bacterium]|nr:DUF502 domain-containing protein [Lentisphaerota bacterium]